MFKFEILFKPTKYYEITGTFQKKNKFTKCYTHTNKHTYVNIL